MHEEMIVHHAGTAVVLVLLLSMPPIIVATVVGVLVSLIQTLGFAIKLIAVVVTMVATAPWLGAQMREYTLRIFEQFPMLTR